MIISTKQLLREEFRSIRSQIPSAYRIQAALNAAGFFTELTFFEPFRNIACYLPFGDEFDTRPLVNTILQRGKKCYLPVLVEVRKDHLEFVEYQQDTKLLKNKFGILQPIDLKRRINPEALDLVFAPLIAYDKYGHRLGTGGGYYDRVFSFRATKEGVNKKPLIIGLCFAAQEAPQLPIEQWDVDLDGVLTEKGLELSKGKKWEGELGS